MTTQQIVILIAVLAVIAVLVVRRGGPHVTQIDRTVRKEKDSDDA
jgi:hypothetical protein